MPVDALSVLCAQLTRDLLPTAMFLLMIKPNMFVQNKRNLVADILRATDLLRADWLYTVKLGQLRRRRRSVYRDPPTQLNSTSS